LNPNSALGQANVNLGAFTSVIAPIAVTTASNLGNGGSSTPLIDKDNTYQLNGSVSYMHGKHSLKVGESTIYRQASNQQNSQGEGSWTFSSLPNLVQGVFSAVTRSNMLVIPHYRTWEWEFFGQDDWRVSQNLTVNAGVRYDLYTPYTEIKNQNSTFNPETGKIQVAGLNGISNTAGINPDYSNIEPRIGFALSLPHTTVIRGSNDT
jgi:outer membrane receptor protein involved in Fe transport